MVKDFFIRTRTSQTILNTPETWLQKQFSDRVILIILFFPKFLVIHIIRLFSGVYPTARGSLLKTDSMLCFRNHCWDGQSCLGCRQAAFAGVKANLVSKLCRLLAKRIRFLLPPDNSTSLPQVHPAPNSIQHIHGVGQRGLPELPAAQPRGSQLQSCHVSDPDCQDRAAPERQPSSQIELRLRHPIWSGVLRGICRKLSLKPVQQHNWHSTAMPQGSRFFSLWHQGHL